MADRTPNSRRLALRNARMTPSQMRRVTPKERQPEDVDITQQSNKENASPIWSPAVPHSDARSPTPLQSGMRPRSMKLRARTGARRSVSGETRQYIDHLETELQSAQTQLSAMTSPGLTRRQGKSSRELLERCEMLQVAVDEWDERYDERVQQVAEQYAANEHEYVAQIKELGEALEQKQTVQLQRAIDEVEQAGEQRIQDALEVQATEMATMLRKHTEEQRHLRETIEILEAENLRLEKKSNTMSDMLATSKSFDLHAEPDKRQQHGRAKSMLPKFPTTSNLLASPERRPLQNSAFSCNDLTLGSPVRYSHELLDTPRTPSDYPSDEESSWSETPALSESCSTASESKRYSMPPPALPTGRGRPTRRMRRFGAGSVGPRPLILPAASHWENVPMSAPAFEKGEQVDGFPFAQHGREEQDASPVLGRRRASTTASQLTLANLEASEALGFPPTGAMRQVVSPRSAGQNTPTNYSSLGSRAGGIIGRNLLEELNDCSSYVRTEESGATFAIDGRRDISDSTTVHPHDSGTHESLVAANEFTPAPQSNSALRRARDLDAIDGTKASTSTLGLGIPLLTRLRLLFASPGLAARHLLHSAQQHMCLPAVLREWHNYLLSILLGPLARRRHLSSHLSRRSSGRGRLLPSTPRAPEAEGDHALAYGTMYQSSGCAACRREEGEGQGVMGNYGPWHWLRFSLTLAFALGVAVRRGPGSLLLPEKCACTLAEHEEGS